MKFRQTEVNYKNDEYMNEEYKLNEASGVDLKVVADEFTRFLIGDRERALKQLTNIAKKNIKGIDDGVLKGMVDNKGKFAGDYNAVFDSLFGNIYKGLKDSVKKHSKG